MTVGPHRHAAEAMRAWRAAQEQIHARMREAAETARRERIEREINERWHASMRPIVEALEPTAREFTTTVRTCVCGRRFSQGGLVELECCSACSRDMLPSRNPLLSPYDEVEAMGRAKVALSRWNPMNNDYLFGPDNPFRPTYVNTENAILEELGLA